MSLAAVEGRSGSAIGSLLSVPGRLFNFASQGLRAVTSLDFLLQ